MSTLSLYLIFWSFARCYCWRRRRFCSVAPPGACQLCHCCTLHFYSHLPASQSRQHFGCSVCRQRSRCRSVSSNRPSTRQRRVRFVRSAVSSSSSVRLPEWRSEDVHVSVELTCRRLLPFRIIYETRSTIIIVFKLVPVPV